MIQKRTFSKLEGQGEMVKFPTAHYYLERVCAGFAIKLCSSIAKMTQYADVMYYLKTLNITLHLKVQCVTVVMSVLITANVKVV